MKKEPSPVNKFIGGSISKFRKDKKLNQQNLADLLGLSRPSIANYEAGAQSPPADKLYILACIFKVEVSEFFPHLKDIGQAIDPSFEEVEIVKIKKIKKPLKLTKVDLP